MASDYDYLPASNGSGDAALMHITVDRLVASTTIKVDSVVNVPTKFIGTSGTLLASGYINPATKKDMKCHVSGADIIIDGFEPGSTDTGNIAGQVLIVKPNTGWSNRVAQFIKNSTGFGTPEAVTFAGVTATSGAFSGNTSTGGNHTVTGNVAVTGTVRSTPRVNVQASTATLAPNIDSYSIYDLTALAANMAVSAPTGTPRNGDAMILRIKDNGTSRTISWDAIFTDISGVGFLTATTISKWHVVGIVYNSAVTKWQIVSVSTEA